MALASRIGFGIVVRPAPRPVRPKAVRYRLRRTARSWTVQQLEDRTMLSTFTVTNTLDDTNPGSLRWAIGQVNSDPNPGVDTINFRIAGIGPFTIAPGSSLPEITHPVTINGYSQPGASPNTQSAGDNAVILIQLDGTNSNDADGLTIGTNGSVVKGLAVTNFDNGVHVLGNDDQVVGDFLGTDPTGTAAGLGNQVGVLIDGGTGNRVGGTAIAARNIISGNHQTGALFQNGATGNVLLNSYIGVDATGGGALANQTGVLFMDSPANTVGGLAAGAGNVISANTFNGIALEGSYGTTASGGTVIQGNLIGTDASGSAALGNGGQGVAIFQGSNNVIGGTTAAARNVLSGNLGVGLLIDTGSNLVQGNYVGTDARGLVALGQNNGIGLGAPGNTIGGTARGAGNLVSGDINGIYEQDSAPNQGNVIQGNLIGTDRTGKRALGNSQTGMTLLGNDDLVGGTMRGAGNVIAANRGDGILVAYATGSVFEGNLIGTDISGTVALGNAGNGIDVINNVSGITIGGTTAAARNVIAANGGSGVSISVGATGVLVQGNSIGADASGSIALGNASDGAVIVGGTSNNTIGGTAAGAGNIIAYNGAAGVLVGAFWGDLSTGDAILSNSIHDNAALGIDLGADGVTPNTPGGPHVGPNDLQNFPVLFAAVTYGGKTTIKGMLNSASNTPFRIQFFANAAADPSGYGEGQTLIAQTVVGTDGSGNASFQITISGLAAGQFVSATATDPNGNTSEFSADVSVVAISQPLYAVNDMYNVDKNTSLVVPAPGVLGNDISVNRGSPSSILVTGPSHGSLTLNADGSFSYTPAANYVGPDSFTYRDVLGSVQSNVATVSISVNPKVYVVTNTNDSGPGSLRQAIEGANLASSPAPNTIDFDIPGAGPFTITPLTPLPAIGHATIIDGYSQPGSRPNTLAQGDNAVIPIVLGSRPGYSQLYDGLTITAGGSTVEGLDIHGFNNAIHLSGSGNDRIVGDFFANNTNSVFVDGIATNTIGGLAAAARNVFSFSNTGVLINGSGGNLIENSYFGTDPTGTQYAGNAYGVQIENSAQNTVGGTVAAARNLFAGNNTGVLIVDTGGSTAGANLVVGNYLGTDVTGKTALPNAYGVTITDAPNNTIGGTSSGAANVLSGNNGAGVQVTITSNPSAASGTLIVGNLIGTDARGTAALGNGDGIIISASNVTVGGTSRRSRNVISSNHYDGVDVYVGTSSGNLIEGNLIGTDQSGQNPLGNGGNGVYILFGASNNTVGGLAAGAGNVIAYNGKAGVDVGSNLNDLSTGDAILSNSIYDNAALGIDLGNNGVTPNTPGGPHTGPNDLQNFPVLTGATQSSSKITIVGTLNSIPTTTFTLQFFANAAADPSGYGQGQTLLGTATVTTNNAGNASFTVSFSSRAAVGQFVSATATDPNGNTSEFARDVTITGGSTTSPRAVTILGRFAPAPQSVGIVGRFAPATPMAPLSGRSTGAAVTARSKAGPMTDPVLEALAIDLIQVRRRRLTAIEGTRAETIKW